MARKQLRVSIPFDGYSRSGVHMKTRKYVATDCKLYLSDSDEHGYNHPALNITMRPVDADTKRPSPEDWDACNVSITFQRNLHPSDHEPADGYMDTRKRWSIAYGGHVELDTRLEIDTRGFMLKPHDRVRAKVCQAIAKAIQNGNLHAVHPKDDCKRAVAGLERLGVDVERIYIDLLRPFDDRLTTLGSVSDRRANARAEQEATAH